MPSRYPHLVCWRVYALLGLDKLSLQSEHHGPNFYIAPTGITQKWIFNMERYMKVIPFIIKLYESVFLSEIQMRIYIYIASALTDWGRVTHICVSNLNIIGPDNGLSPSHYLNRCWNIAGIWPLATNFSEILIEIHTSSVKKIHLKLSSAK